MGIQSADQILKRLEFESGGELKLQNAKSLIRVQTKTADYTVTVADSGTYFTTSGDTGAITFTLPAVAAKGLNYHFVQTVDQDLTVTAGTVDTLCAYNDLAADGVAFSTSSHQIGQMFFVFADGTQWHALALTSGTLTVNT